MWGKFSHCLVRSEASAFFRTASHLFSILTAFQFLHKNFYDQFILKKLEFEPIITEVSERLRTLYSQVRGPPFAREDALERLATALGGEP